MPEVSRATTDKCRVYRRVAELHIACINKGFLSTLGVGFLSLMYQAIDEGQDSVLLIAHDGDQIVGFVSGSSGMGPIYRRMLRKWPRLFAALLPPVLSPRGLWRIFEIVRYSHGDKSSVLLTHAELLSIAVDARFRARGHGDRLYESLCEYFRNRGVPEFKIVVGAALEPAHRFYRRMGAMPATQVAVHKGELSTVYVQKVK